MKQEKVFRITFFNWKHKLLNALEQLDFEHFEGIVTHEYRFLFVI